MSDRRMYLFVLLLFGVCGCERKLEMVSSREDPADEPNVKIEAEYVAQVQKCMWFEDKVAAYTISFDDARASHYQVAGPLLHQRNICGTFFINTREIKDWSGWQNLADMGHEIGSHTWSHPRMTALTEAQQRAELEHAIFDIRSNLRGAPPVYSFCYPYGLFDDALRRVVQEYHISARGGGGVNRSGLSDEALTMVRGSGVYPPYDMTLFARILAEALSKKGWVNVYFHSVSARDDSNDTTIPLRRFIEHLDDVEKVRGQLWIATQAQVANYIRLHRDAGIKVEEIDQVSIKISLERLPENISDISRLTVKLALPNHWRNHKIFWRKGNQKSQEIVNADGDRVYLHIGRDETVFLEAKMNKKR